jgi:hypothetical protein
MDSDLVTAELADLLADRIANAESRRAPIVACGQERPHLSHLWTPTCGYHDLKRCHGRTE